MPPKPNCMFPPVSLLLPFSLSLNSIHTMFFLLSTTPKQSPKLPNTSQISLSLSLSPLFYFIYYRNIELEGFISFLIKIIIKKKEKKWDPQLSWIMSPPFPMVKQPQLHLVPLLILQFLQVPNLFFSPQTFLYFDCWLHTGCVCCFFHKSTIGFGEFES